MVKTATKEKQENTNKVKGVFINKIQIKEGRGIIQFSDDCDSALKEGSFTGKDECTEEFKNIFQSSKEIFGEIFPAVRKELDSIKMNAIQLVYDKQGFLEKVLFSVIFTLKQGNVINISTPQIPIYKENMAETTLAVSGKHVELLHEIIAKAKAYIDGETRTKQMTLIVDNTQN